MNTPTTARRARPVLRTRRARGVACARVVACALVVASALLVAGCSAAPNERPETVAFEELDDRRRELVLAYGEGGERWEAAFEDALGDERLERFLVINLTQNLVRHFESGELLRAGAPDSPYERARSALARLGPRSAAFLARMVAEGPDDIVAEAGADTLASMGDVALEPLLELMAVPEADTRRRACASAGRLARLDERAESRLADALVERAANDPAWIVRAEAVRACGSRVVGHGAVHASPYAAALADGLDDPDPAVVGIAADGLGRAGIVAAVPALVGALGRMQGQVGAFDRIQRALGALVGERGARDPQQWWALWLERRAELLGARDRG